MTAPTIEKPVAGVDFGDRSARRRRRLRLLGVIALVIVIGATTWLLFFSSMLAVKNVRVVGVEGAFADEVLTAAAVPGGAPLVTLDTARAQSAILALPWVASAEVRRGWPDEVVLAVEARVPIAVLVGSKQVVDASGMAFDAVGAPPTGLPSVSGKDVGLEAAMGVLAALPPDIAVKVASLSATTRDNVDLTLRSGALVHWGSAEQADFKAQVLRALLRHRRDVYDVTAPELPTTFKTP